MAHVQAPAASHEGPRKSWKAKVWLVCPTCDQLVGYVYPEFLKRSGGERKGGRREGDAEE